MRRILQISNHIYPKIGGIEQVARDVVGVLKDESVEQKVICFNADASDGKKTCKGNETVIDTVDGVEVIRCGSIAKVASQPLSLTFPQELKKTLTEFMPDTVIFHYPNPYQSTFLLPLLKKDTKLIVFWHLDITRQKLLGKLFHRQNIALLKRADKIVATSPDYIEGSPYLSRFKEKITVIPCCVQTDKFKVTAQISDKINHIREQCGNKILCFTVGRHVPYKGLTYLIQASKYLDDSFRIIIGGQGPLTESLKEEAKGDPKIIFLGRMSDEDLVAYCHACDIYCFSSITKNEAFGIALAEGMYCGKPAVTFTIPGSGVNYVNLDGITGIECPNGDSKAYAEALKTLAKNPELRERYGKAARQRVLENFTVNIFKKKLMQLIGGLNE